jgi:molecular chaperone DnaK
LVTENSAKLGDADKMQIEEAVKDAESVLERNKDASSPDELRSAFEKLQASAHKLAEAMYKTAGAEGGGAGGGEQPPHEDKNADVIDAEFEDKS